jgi:hypothetical protein
MEEAEEFFFYAGRPEYSLNRLHGVGAEGERSPHIAPEHERFLGMQADEAREPCEVA